MFGYLADKSGIQVCMYVTAAVSVLAGIENAPLILNPRFGPQTIATTKTTSSEQKESIDLSGQTAEDISSSDDHMKDIADIECQ